MPRVKRGTNRRDRRRKVLKLAKGFRATKSKLYRSAKQAVDKALVSAYRGRREKKRDFRSLWIVRIGAAARANEMSYSTFMAGLSKANVDLNRKQLAELAIQDEKAFSELATVARQALSAT
ncbi:MAG TPA: 50S ribosomal protein L20 [Vicinamibacteria bacterium]|jgi:large subunit ribosomal protein L20